MCDVKDELHVHGSLWYTSTPSMDDRDQSVVQFIHVALREEPASTASLVLHLGEETSRNVFNTLDLTENKILEILFTISACVEMRRESELMPLEVRTAR